MTYEEFKEKVEKIVPCTMWYEYKGDEIILVYLDGLLARFNLKDERSYVIYYTNLKSLIDLTDDTIYKNIKELVEELVETPIEERVQEQKYYVKPVLPDFINARRIYLNRETYTWNDPGTDYTLNTRNQNSDYQTQFTMEEIKEIIPKEDMDKFKIIPVEEEE